MCLLLPISRKGKEVEKERALENWPRIDYLTHDSSWILVINDSMAAIDHRHQLSVAKCVTIVKLARSSVPYFHTFYKYIRLRSRRTNTLYYILSRPHLILRLARIQIRKKKIGKFFVPPPEEVDLFSNAQKEYEY